jgi:hypothetical protein
MQTNIRRAALIGAWVLAVAAFGYISGTSTFMGWTLLAVISLALPVLMGRLWSGPSQTMSESIREAVQDEGRQTRRR